MNGEIQMKEKVSKDAQVMMAIIRNMGIEEWEPKVIQQMLEYSYKYKSNKRESKGLELVLSLDTRQIWRVTPSCCLITRVRGPLTLRTCA